MRHCVDRHSHPSSLLYGFHQQRGKFACIIQIFDPHADIPDLFRRAADYVDKILRGSKPADIPVEQPTKFDLVINLTTAKVLKLHLPPILLARADEVIE